MASEGVRPFGPTALVTMMKCRLNGGGLCLRHESAELPRPLCPTHGYCSNPFRVLERGGGGGCRREVGENECYISSFLPLISELICQPWEDKHVFYTLDLLLSEGRPLLGCLTKSCSWQSVCIIVMLVV